MRRVGGGQERAVAEPTVQDQDLDSLFAGVLAPFTRAVLAVSGGSDSMALMVLLARWVALGRAPAGLVVDVATVDHGLRADSAQDADWVAARAKALGFAHTTLVWAGDKPATGIQERAREARYALLVAHASGRGPAAVVTAHTSDDQAETLLMRLARGSGLDGLAGMAPSRPLLPDGSVHLVRPLLGLSKSALAATLTQRGGTWREDPSNARDAFERVRLRSAHAHQAALGLESDKLALSAARLFRAREALEQITEARLSALVDAHGGVFASMDRAAWASEPGEVRVRLLARLLAAFGGAAGPAQLAQVEALEAALMDGRPLAQTLGGCIVSQGRSTLRLYREPGHRGLPEATLAPGEETLWDWRFRVRYAPPSDEGEAPGEPVAVRPLGLSAYATLRGDLDARARPPALAAAGLPSVWAGDRLLAVPAFAGRIAGDARFTAEFLGLGRVLR